MNRRFWKFRFVATKVADRFLFSLAGSTASILLLAALPISYIWFQSYPSPFLVAGWFAFLLLYVLANLLGRGEEVLAFQRKLGRVNGSFKGNIESLTLQFLHNDSHTITEQVAQNLCVGLLHRIRQYTELALRVSEPNRLRATLAVPIVDADSRILNLRVWCYDEPYADRRWTKIPIGLPGSPMAFSEKRIMIIHDLWAIDDLDILFRQRRFRSVVSIPVTVGGPAGECIAVVNLDSALPRFFDVDSIHRMMPLIDPVVASIALVLASLDPSEKYHFAPDANEKPF